MISHLIQSARERARGIVEVCTPPRFRSIVVRLTGGLGNQMFQYAYARSKAVSSGEELKLDLSWYHRYSKQEQRQYSLGYFRIHESFASKLDVARARALRGKYLCGYFGDEPSITSWHTMLLRNEFQLRKPRAHAPKFEGNTVCVSIRRGDYLTRYKHMFVALSLEDYYYPAMNLIAEKVEKPVFVVFSDDISWAKQNFKSNYPLVFVDNVSDYEDLMLMTTCKHYVIANSTFSWWGAWLSRSQNKIVVAPSKWFTKWFTVQYQEKSAPWMPKEWTRIE